MNGIKCPNCDLVNMLSATECHRCQTLLVDLPPTAEVSVPIEETFEAQTAVRQNPLFAMQPPINAPEIPQDNELGRKTYFWYRIYLVFMTMIYVAFIGLGVLFIYLSQSEPHSIDATEMFANGIILVVVGIPFAVVFAVGLFLPRKSWNWVVGIIYIALTMTSCCFMPIAIPLLIYWLKPETQAYFGRK